ncbi:MAG TPA: sensor histidine kinase, partial [Chitinophagaceae bacterium]|nr:sensor histidine kinase [Chitinophagaceae bacterium]
MFQQIINWRVLVAIIAILIVSGTIVYSRYLANKIAIEEKQKVEEWVEAGKFIVESPNEADTRLPFKIIENNENDVPIIETDEKDSIIQFINLDSVKIAKDGSYLHKKLRNFKSQN